MGQDQITQLLQQGIAAARGNQADVARGIFQQVLTLDPRNEVAWAWLANMARNDRERLLFLRKLLEVNPQSEYALKQLASMGIDPESVLQPPEQSAVPMLDDTRYARVQQAVDDFLRLYTPEPADRLAIDWVRGPRKRYADRGVQQLRRVVYGVAGLVVLLVAAGIIFVLMQIDFTGSEGQQVARSTRIPTDTPVPTLTPTPGGATPTPIRTPLYESTAIADLRNAGTPYGISTVTPMFPRPNPDVERIVEEAIDYYTIGQYQTTADMLSEERERSEPACYPYVVYYEALSYAHMGEFARAESVLEWARTYQAPRPYESCQGSALVTAGIAEVAYLQNPASMTALNLSEQALDVLPEFIPAVLTKGRAQLAMGQVSEAWITANRALETHPQDTNLLLLAAQTELARDQALTALDYIGQALYVDPDLLPALHLQAEAYLTLAQNEVDAARRLQAYGFAVRSAQLIQQYYEGDPLGYLYLAQARIGEGNTDMAETALSRILAVADDLPDAVQDIVDMAYRLRGELRFRQGRFAAARDDLEQYATRLTAPDAGALEMLVQSALETNEFNTARQWIAYLLTRQPENPRYVLWQVQLQVELCTLYPDALTCQYADALDTLSDDFVMGLDADRQRAEALSYRAQARYHTVIRQRAALDDDEREAELRQALADTAQALAIRESVLDHYYRGLLFEELGEPVQAFEEYRWVAYWDAQYDYPFTDSDFAERLAVMADEAREGMDEVVIQVTPPTPPPDTPEPTGEAPEETATPEETNAPLATATPSASATPRGTATPTPEPTPISPAPIP